MGAGGGGGGATTNAGYQTGSGAAGSSWYGTEYGRGGDGQNTNSGNQSSNAGAGQSSYAVYGANTYPAKAGIFIVRWPE